MDMIHTPPATGPTQSQLDDALGRAEELQERLSQLERERENHFRDLEVELVRARLEADSMRRVILCFVFNTSVVASLSAFC